MKVQFAKKWLLTLYETGSAKEMKRFPKGLDKQFFKVMDLIEAASTIQDLFAFTSLNFKHLQGKRNNQHSLRLNKQYRLIVELDDLRAPTTFTICDIEDYH